MTDSASGTRLFDKVWQRHLVASPDGEPPLLYIDLHLVHEVTSPQAFEGLELAGRKVRRPDLTVATMDHDVPTVNPLGPITDPLAAEQMARLRKNCETHRITLYPLGSAEQGVVHVIGPQLGLTQPGMTVVCGDSHTSTHGAFGALAFGIGTTEVEHVLATQTLRQPKPQAMAVTVDGELPEGVTAKDLVLGIIAEIGVGGGAGSVIEYRGEAVRALDMEGRMTVCNMSIEGGARAGMIAPDDTTFAFLEGRPHAPKGAAWERALDDWRSLATDEHAVFDREVRIDAASLRPVVTWGTNPSQSVSIDGVVPDPASFGAPGQQQAVERALEYMGLSPGTAMRDIAVDTVFIGSCTNGRIADLRSAASVLRGRTISSGVRAIVVPGSARVKAEAEAEGLDQVFRAAGFEWRSAGCSMCLGMNGDILAPRERSASTSNRNFEGRQGPGGRTHLVSPAMAAATAVAGRFAVPGDLPQGQTRGGQ
ncbi:MAG: 3-isopropylmalate dehydratase large subunit [Nocardiopsaceae bacterium]|jgi:3-isopropylmalate/(R)-2-methylmalate dehydratase large subunit|nr:3-isopropylmalate dehydratase large subunit [Nocardiopsaceae bacterium]